ncbi:MAG: HAD-IIA family hydrolase [candidate division KSB1 bacterium]|nr:HAD-IIA family hydrolase [candidate division KSB1 bacterium]
MTPELIRKRLEVVRCFVLDMDGTIYLGNELFPFTLDFLKALEEKARDFIFLTNNSSQSARDYAQKLSRMGIQVPPEKIYTSGDATIEYLLELNQGKNLFLLGTKSLHRAFREAGFVTDSCSPDFVVLGFDLTFNFQKLDQACRFIRRGVPFIATHPDFNCPQQGGDMLPDCGALAAAITAATGVSPKVIGKPNQEMLNGLLKRLNLNKKYLAFIGDRLMTDIRIGELYGITTILILTGETKSEHLAHSPIKPDFVFEKIIDIAEYL